MEKQLEYDSNLNLEESGEKYERIEKEFNRIKSNYFGLFRKFRRGIRSDDEKSLNHCVDNLLKLELQYSVQDEIRQARIIGEITPHLITSVEDTVHSKITKLNFQIINYLANFGKY